MAGGRRGPTPDARAERLVGFVTTTGPSRARPLAAAVALYGLVAIVTFSVAAALGRNPLECTGWLGITGSASWLVSLGVGVFLGAATIGATRILVRRAAWAHDLHIALRPAVAGASDAAVLLVAAASAIGEEALFRGLLVPLLGVTVSSLVFGSVHQIRGSGRWAWIAWATVMGWIFAILFSATGNLAGPLVAHAAINYANLRFLRDNDPTPRRRQLGGLLQRG